MREQMSGYAFVLDGLAYTPDGDTPEMMTEAQASKRNKALSVAELAYWQEAKPEKYTGYIHDETTQEASTVNTWNVTEGFHRAPCVRTITRRTFTTWLGDLLGHVTYYGPRERAPLPGIERWPQDRILVRIQGTNGRKYWGWYYVETQQCITVKAYKERS